MKKEEAEYIERVLDKNAELRNENHRLRVFMQSLIDPEMYGHATSQEVRQAAQKLLGDVYARQPS